MAIHFFYEDIKEFKLSKRVIRFWISKVITSYNKIPGDINYIFCSDEYLKNINIEYLNHNYFTDIITFNYNVNDKIIGDLYISIDRVKENAQYYKVVFLEELLRVIIHGVLHLIGFNDTTEEEQKIMTKEENKNIELYNIILEEKANNARKL